MPSSAARLVAWVRAKGGNGEVWIADRDSCHSGRMTPRERVLSVLEGKKPDRVPWFADLDYYAEGLVARGAEAPGFQQSDRYVAWHRELGAGFYQQASWPYREVHEGCEVLERRDGPNRTRQVVTPAGTITERWQWSDLTLSQAPVERLVKGVEDLPAYRYLMAHTRYEPDFAMAERRRVEVAGMGVVMCFLPWSPLMRLVVIDAGIECAVTMLTDAPDAFEETLAAVKESLDRASAVSVSSPAEVLMITENLSSEVVGERLYERFLRPSYEEWSGKIRAAGKHSCIHMDGTLAGLLRQVSAVGFSFIEAMTPAPVGDIAVRDWPRYRGKGSTIYWGGIPGSYFTPVVGDGEFDRHVKEVLSVMRTDGRMVLGVADQVPPDGLEYRIRRVAELVEEHGAC